MSVCKAHSKGPSGVSVSTFGTMMATMFDDDAKTKMGVQDDDVDPAPQAFDKSIV